MKRTLRNGQHDHPRSGSAGRIGGPLLAAALLLTAVAFALTAGASEAKDTSQAISESRAALEKWVQTSRTIAREKRKLALAKEMLRERIGVVEGEIQTLREKTDEARRNIREVEEKRSALEAEDEKLQQTASVVSDRVARLETRTKQLLARLPDPIRDRIRPLSQQIPEDPGQTELSLSQRFQNLVGILNEVNKFNRLITVTSEVRTLEDGTSVEVTALYVGVGQAYYTGANSTVAGVGRPSEKGWTWTPANHAAAQISQAVAIFRNEQPASFVQLPIEIDQPGS